MPSSIKFHTLSTLFLCLITSSLTLAQVVKSNDIIVRDENGDVIPHAWAGGLNAPQFSQIDLDNDGIKDLFVFDREGNRVMTFLNGGTSNKVDYTYAPEYEQYFPELFSWALLIDYNNDGKEDIFTYNTAGIKVFKNTSTGNTPSFAIAVSPYLTSYGSSGTAANIYATAVDLPAIVDVDFDGDLDILNFGLVTNNAVTYYENFAQDSGSLETFRFHDNTYCWGNFKEDALTNKVTLNETCPMIMIQAKGNKHAGSTILGFDPDNDQDIDLLVGDPTFTNLVYLENGGDKTYANMVSQDTLFPSYDQSVDLRIFPAAYNIDVNNDGRKDLLICPNAENGIENHEGVHYFRNTGNASSLYQLVTNDFLQSEMIDLGSYAYPVFYDHNGDGLLDLIVGNGGYYQGPNPSIHALALFENVGSTVQPEFQLKTRDYAGIGQLNLNTQVNLPTRNVIPAFGSLNNDGKDDMIIGDFQGNLHFFVNKGSNGLSDFEFQEANFEDIDVNADASPFIYDLDGDGKHDVICGKKNGRLSYYRNQGSPEVPKFDSLYTGTLGKVNTVPWFDFNGYSQARFYKAENSLYLLSGSTSGQIYRYGNIEGNLTGNFSLLDTAYLGIDAGRRSHVDLADLDNDGDFEFIVGNSGGGLTFFYTDEKVGIEELRSSATELNKLNAYLSAPGNLRVEWPSAIGRLSVFNILGEELVSSDFNEIENINTGSWPMGVYIVSINSNGTMQTKKIILAR